MDCCFVTHNTTTMDSMYWSGTYPYDPFWGYGGYGHVETSSGESGCCSACFRCICFPIAWLFYVFPVMPENAWGGLVGRIMGTHVQTTQGIYTGGNSFVEFMRMGWRRTHDLHDLSDYRNADWRTEVFEFLQPQQNRPHDGGPAGHADQAPLLQGDTIRVGRARAFKISRSFRLEEDRCFRSSFEDYEKNECWICASGNEEWDLWVGCKHLFCKDCSTNMLVRNMPCPLCRVASNVVQRGKKYGSS